MFVTYILCNPLKDNRPFYVGWSEIKNKNFERLKQHQFEALALPKKCNLHKCRIIKNSIQAEKKVLVCLIHAPSREIAIDNEIRLIKFYGRADKGIGPLTNLTDGGDGTRGWTEDQKESQRKKVGIPYSKKYPEEKATEIKRKISSVSKGKKQSEKHKLARSKSMIGKNTGKVSIGSTGMKWFNNGIENRLLFVEDAKELSLSLGRLPYDRRKRS